MRSLPFRPDHGPVRPKGVTEAHTTPGLPVCTSSYPQPIASSSPIPAVSTTTSARPSRSANTRRPSAVATSTTIDSLLALWCRWYRLRSISGASPSRNGARWRTASPPGGSRRNTWAPRSARMRVAKTAAGPARSTTSMPRSGSSPVDEGDPMIVGYGNVTTGSTEVAGEGHSVATWIPLVNWAADRVGGIHHDETAREKGFPAGLVPGDVHVSLITAAAVARIGPPWYEEGWLRHTFVAPAYTGDEVEVRVRGDDDHLVLEMVRRDGVLICIGQAGRGGPAPWDRIALPARPDGEGDPLPHEPVG